MPNQINSKNPPKTYDSGEMYDVQSLAAQDMHWMQTALDQLRHKIFNLKKNLNAQYGINEIFFDELETLSHMYSYLADERHKYHAEMAEIYEKEWQCVGGDQ